MGAALFVAACSAPKPGEAPSDSPQVTADAAALIPIEAEPALDAQPWRADVEGLLADALARGRSFDLLTGLCTAAPHRLAGSPGAERAVAWALRAMSECGLENVRAEPVMVPRWERGATERLELVSADGSVERELAVLALGGSVGTPVSGITAEVVAVKSFDELRALGEGARGKIVLFDRPLDPALLDTFAAYGGAVDQRSRGAIEAARAGALAALVRSMTHARDDAPHTGAMGYADGVAKVPAAAVSTQAADLLSSRIAGGESVRVRLTMSCRTLDDVESANVVGEIVGRERPDEIVVVGGHLDAWDVGQGAHDDGAGCVHAIEALRLIKARGLRPRRTLRAVMFMNEENGTRGARAYFEAHAGEMERHMLALESDRGGFTPRGFTTDANADALAILREIAALLEAAGAGDVSPGWGGVDIAPMARAGVPLVGFLPDDERYFDFHHSANDVLAAVHPRELALGAGAIAGLVYVVADLPATLPRNSVAQPARADQPSGRGM